MDAGHAQNDFWSALEGEFTENSRWEATGIQLEACAAFERLLVRTLHSEYELIVVSGADGDVLVRGGRLFPEFRPARLTGATSGGHTVKLRGIYVGLHMELFADGRPVVTSPVAALARLPVPSNTPH